MHRLPPYSPALNPIELYLGVVNYTEMPGRTYPTMSSLLAAIDQALTRCQQRLPNQPRSLKSH